MKLNGNQALMSPETKMTVWVFFGVINLIQVSKTVKRKLLRRLQEKQARGFGGLAVGKIKPNWLMKS